MKIKLSTVMVHDQAEALKFYTEVLGFVVKNDIPMGEYRWLTVVSPEGHLDIELLLEPMAFAPAQIYQKALRRACRPMHSLLMILKLSIKEWKRLRQFLKLTPLQRAR